MNKRDNSRVEMYVTDGTERDWQDNCDWRDKFWEWIFSLLNISKIFSLFFNEANWLGDRLDMKQKIYWSIENQPFFFVSVGVGVCVCDWRDISTPK